MMFMVGKNCLRKLTIFGDGEQTRDFINVRDVVQANIKAAMTRGVSGAFNAGSGGRITINNLVDMMRNTSGLKPRIEYGAMRPGDVLHSLADISAARHSFGFEPSVSMEEGLQEYMVWAASEIAKTKI
jgi:nucleoside-diphosphate-sugar epimerase